MNSRVLLFVTLPFVIVTIALVSFGVYLGARQTAYERQRTEAQRRAEAAAAAVASSGSDFLVEGRRVKASLFVPSEVRRGDSLSVVLRLDQGPAGPTSGLGNEHDGALTPVLAVADCQVTPSRALSKSTKQPLPAFVWGWSVDGCPSAGDKAVQVLLLFTRTGADNGSDPVAYRGLSFVQVSDPFSWEEVIKVLGALSAVLTIVSIVVGIFDKRSSVSDQAQA